MMNARRFGRLGLLAVGLGVGAALAASPGIASADPSPWFGEINPGGPDIPAASSPHTLDFQISINEHDLFPTADNLATAESGKGDLAIAVGDKSFACAGCTDSPGTHDFAFAHGANTAADSGFGNYDSAIASHGGFDAAAGAGNFDTAIANGENAFANAGGIPGAEVGEPNIVSSNFDFADAVGANTNAEAGNILTENPTGNDVALVFDPSGTEGSTALAGDGKFDLAAVLFADGLTANATGGNGIVDILPSMAADAGSSGGHFLADLLALF